MTDIFKDVVWAWVRVNEVDDIFCRSIILQ